MDQGLFAIGLLQNEHSMHTRPAWMTRLVALAIALIGWCASTASASVHVTYNVGHLASAGGDDAIFSASWLHDATSSPNLSSGTNANRAYRSGMTSDLMSGSLYGELNQHENALSDIGGTVSGNLKMLLGDAAFDSPSFVLRLGMEAGKTGKLKFETNGAGTGEYSGGYLDFALDVGSTLNVVTGTFFFKPQAETGSSVLSPNRGNSSAFTLWGYNWMHDSGPIDGSPNSVDWAKFLGKLGYTGDTVLRTDALGNTLEQALGVALYVSDPSPPPPYASNPEPTTLVVWAVLMSVGACYCGRKR